jgi:hypothetical protein
VKVDDLPAPGRLVQPVHVLGERTRLRPLASSRAKGVMGVVWLRSSEATPADHATGPIATSGGIVRDELLEAHGRRSLPAAVGVPIIRYAGVRAAPRSRQHQQPMVILDECLEIAVSHAGRK